MAVWLLFPGPLLVPHLARATLRPVLFQQFFVTTDTFDKDKSGLFPLPLFGAGMHFKNPLSLPARGVGGTKNCAAARQHGSRQLGWI